MRATLRNTGTLFTLIALFTVPVQAQLGGLLKRAAKKVAEKTVDEKVDEQIESTAPAQPLGGDPLTEATLDALLKGLSLELETQGRTKQLWTAIEAKSKEVTEAERAAGNEPDAWQTASRDVERCVSSSIDKSNDRHQEEMPQKLMAINSPGKDNAAFIAKLTEIGQRMNDAQARKDTPGYNKAMEDYLKILGFDPAKDSVVAFAACGRLPAKPASMVKLERLKTEVNKLSDERRIAEVESEARAAKAAGMPADKYALARERLWAWSAARKQKQPARSLTKDEDVLFSARASDIKGIESMLR